MIFIKMGGMGSEFYENKFCFCNCDIKGGLIFVWHNFPSLIFPFSTYFLAHITLVIFNISPIFGQIE